MSFTPSGEQSVEIQIEAEDNASGAFNNVTGSANDMNKAVGAAGGVLAGAGVAAFGKAADAAIGFEEAMADVEKVTGAGVAEELESEIQDLATEVPLAHEELATLATQAGRMGAEGADEIAEFTETAAEMGAATTLSSDEAGQALGKMASALDEPLDNVDELGDAINETSNNFQATSDEIVDSAQRSGQALDTLGLSSDEIIGLSGAFNEVSPTSREAASRMQQVSEAMMDPDNVGMFADMLGVSAEEFEQMREEAPEETMLDLMDAVDGNQGALDTLNDELTTSQARAFRDTADSADTMRDAMDTSNQAMEEGGSLAGKVATETDTMSAQMDLLRSELHNVMIEMGDAFLPVLIDIVEIVGPMVSTFADLNERFDGLPAVIIAATAAIGGLTIALTALTGITATTLLPIIAALGALGATAYAIKQAWDANMGGIQDAAQQMWDAVEPALSSVREFAEDVFEDYIMPLLVELRELWEAEFEAILEDVVETMDVVEDYITTVLDYLGEFWDDHGDTIMQIVETTFAFLEVTIGTILRAISANIRIILAVIRGDFDEALEIVADFWETTFEDILGFIENDFFDGIKAAFSLVFDVIKGIFEAIYDFLIGGSIVPDTFNEILSFLGDWATDTLELFTDFFAELVTLYVETLTDIFETLKATFDTITSWLLGDGLSMVVSAFNTIFDDTIDRLLEFLENLASGIGSTIESITNWVANDGASAFRDAFGAVADAMLDPINSAISRIETAVEDVANYVTGTVQGAIDDAVSAFNSAVPSVLEVPSISVGGGSLNIPSKTINNPLGSNVTIGGGSLSLPSARIGGQLMDLPQLADGGIITDDTLARVGEAGQPEAVVPLQKLSRYLDTAYQVGADTVSPSAQSGGQGTQSALTATLRVEGDGELADLVREHAELVVEEHDASKRARIARN